MPIKSLKIFLLYILFALITSNNLLAIEEDGLDVDSDSLVVERSKNKATFKGNVVLKFRGMVLKTDLIEVFYTKDEQEKQNLEKIIIPGKLKAVREEFDEVAIADKALYEAKDDILTLSGNVLLYKDGNLVKTKTFVYENLLIDKSKK